MDDGQQGDFAVVFSGAGLPEVTQYTVSGPSIVTGRPYRFYLVPENHVGVSTTPSEIAQYRACQAPSDPAAPTRVATSQTSVEIAWTAPEDDGGCALTGYAILVGDEASATADGVSYVEVHAADVRNKPSLNRYAVTALPAPIAAGTTLRFKVTAFNEGGPSGFSTTSSRSLRVVLASVPSLSSESQAASAPQRDPVTSPTLLKVTYSAPASDGGSPITNYEVQMDDGIGGGFHTMAGGDGKVYLKTYFIAQGGGTCAYTQACQQSVSGYGLAGQQYTEIVTTLSLTKG